MQGGRTPQSQGIIPRAVAKVLKMNSLHQVLQLFQRPDMQSLKLMPHHREEVQPLVFRRPDTLSTLTA